MTTTTTNAKDDNGSDIQGRAWTWTSTKGGIVKNLRLTDYAHDEIPNLNRDNHLLVEILNVSLNPGDLKFPLLPAIGWLIKRPASLSFDFCGRILALPENSSKTQDDSRDLRVGQIVWGVYIDLKSLGVLRTIMSIPMDAVYPLPESIPVEHGSALGVAGLTAYSAIAPYAKVSSSTTTTTNRDKVRVLINGATGGVGTFSIQIAKALGMYVIATCSEAGMQLCKDLGADEILDYKSPTFKDDLCRLNPKVDLVIDNVGNDRSFHHLSEGFIKPDGQFVLVALMDREWADVWSMFVSWTWPTWLFPGMAPKRKWRALFTPNQTDNYKPVAALAQENKVRVVVDSMFPFGDVPKAFEKLVGGRTKGKIIIDVGS